MIEHRYGANTHILGGPLLLSWLARLCAPETVQPEVNGLVTRLYENLVARVLDREFPTRDVRLATRMTAHHPGAFFEGKVLAQDARAVVVNLMRAGTLPSHLCYEALNGVLRPQGVRQDHLFASRSLDEDQHVCGTAFAGAKIGGDVEGAWVVIPDPMGATGGTIATVLSHYKNNVGGRAAKFIALHLIVTPEYLRELRIAHPDLVVYAVRVDRGLSEPRVLASVPGEFWDLERGLNDQQYIVPGGGGLGEVMNNSFV
jgi:uracil phosphoribosyltransferase